MARPDEASSPQWPLSGDAAHLLDQAATNEVAHMRDVTRVPVSLMIPGVHP